MAGNSKPNHESAKWPRNEVDTFVKLMVEQVKKGNKTTTTFNKAGWKNIKTQLEASAGRPFNMLQLRNKMNKLRTDYSNFKKLLETSGFRWNAVTRTCTVEDKNVWDKHIQGNPTWSKFRRNGLPQWPELQMIFRDSHACGDGAIINATDIPDEDVENEVDVDQSLPVTPVDIGKDDVENEVDVDQSLVIPVDIGKDDVENEVDVDQSLPVIPVDIGKHDYKSCEIEGDRLSVTRRPDTTPSALRKRSRTADISQALKAIADASRAKMERYSSTFPTSPSPPPVSTDHSITACVAALDTLTDISKDLYLKAIKRMWEDPQWRETFIAFKPDKRIWLLEMLE